MTQNYYYKFYDGHEITLCVPVMRGCIMDGELTPDFLKKGPHSQLISLQDPIEFETDCRNFVSYINRCKLQYHIDTTYYLALKEVVTQHIKNCGRLFFQDLITYINECCLLMKAFGFSTQRLKNEIYSQLLLLIFRDFLDYIKEGNPMTGEIVPFSSTSKFQMVLQCLEGTL